MTSIYRPAVLSRQHYAYSWQIPTEDNLNDRDAVNLLGIRYAELAPGPAREAVFLEILQCMHVYLMKYMNMIMRGHLPPIKSPAGKDAILFLSMLLKHGEHGAPSRLTLLATCRTLHLAFKQMSADEIYDVLALCMMRAVDRYNPNYTVLIKQICDAISKIRKRRGIIEFSIEQITKAVGFDCSSHMRMLVRKGYLESVAGPKKKVTGYKSTKSWPPPNSFFTSGPVGFVYFSTKYFRYYLHEYISKQMRNIESKEDVLQLEHRIQHHDDGTRGSGELRIPHADGALTDTAGYNWAADMTLMKHPLDVSTMTLKWVKETDDKLFRKLTIKQRHLLYMVFVLEYKWVEIATTLNCDTQTARRQFDEIMSYLKGRAGVNKRDKIVSGTVR